MPGAEEGRRSQLRRSGRVEKCRNLLEGLGAGAGRGGDGCRWKVFGAGLLPLGERARRDREGIELHTRATYILLLKCGFA